MAAANHNMIHGPLPRRRVLLANPRGFCAGVERAIETVEAALDRYGSPVYVRRAIVHNQAVIRQLEDRGAIFVPELEDVPEQAIVILSAHGSARSVKAAARDRRLRFADAICPLVAKVHAEVDAWYRAGRHVLLIGHPGHPEIVGTVGQVPAGAVSIVSSSSDIDALHLPPNCAVAYAVQTTFAAKDAQALIEAIQERFADCAGPRASDICYATTNRQAAIEAIAPKCEMVLVAGDATSSNAQRLVEVARAAGCARCVLVSSVADLPVDELAKAVTVGLTAAASTPALVIEPIVVALRNGGFAIEEQFGVSEATRFKPVSLDHLTSEPASGAVEDRLSCVRREIDAVLDEAIGLAPGRNRRLADAMRYACLGGGKRFLAMLALAVADLVGAPRAQAVRIGAAIESVHAQSLIHDDLPCMDDDDLRRGRPTLHRQYDEATAVLAGDALLALAFEILADPATHPDGSLRAALVLDLARAIGQDDLAGGQMMDLHPPANPTRDDLFACEMRKTGALIRYAVHAATMIGECSRQDIARLEQFADALGLVFQIRDDMLDRAGDPAVLGKSVGKDTGAGRSTATSLLGLCGASAEASRLGQACQEALAPFGAAGRPLRDLARFAVLRQH